MGTIFSRILGYARDAAMLALFSRTVTDAFVVAFRFPNLVRRLFGEGSLTISFMPVYIDELHADASGERARKLANAVFTLLSSLTMTLAILAYVFMEPILKLWVGNEAGFASVPGKLELTETLARIMVIYVVLVTSYAFVMGIANALHKFFIPAVAPAAFNLVVIIFAMLPQNLMEVPGALLAWGVVAGGVIQFLLVAVMLWREGYLPRPTIQIRAPGVWTVLRNLGPGLIGLGIYQVMTIANTFFAARLPEGTQSFLYAGDRILELPQSIIAISLGTALLPIFSRQVARGEREAMLETARDGLSAMLFLALPSALGMWLLSKPIVEVLFMRGAFGTEDVLTTSGIIEIYAALLVASSMAKVTVPAFYALKNTWLPATIAGFVLVAHLILAYFWVDIYGVRGLALATTVSGALNMLALQVAFQFMIGPMPLIRSLGEIARMIPALAGMGVVIWALQLWTQTISLSSLPIRATVLTLIIVIAVATYFFVATFTGVTQAERFKRTIARRLKKKQ